MQHDDWEEPNPSIERAFRGIGWIVGIPLIPAIFLVGLVCIFVTQLLLTLGELFGKEEA